MKIFIDQFLLCDGEHDSPQGLSINGRQLVQSVSLLRSDVAGVYPRGNRLNTVAFSVTREHASGAAAAGFLFRHTATLPASGDVVFLCEDPHGETVRYTAEAAVVTSDQGTQLGATTTHRYTVVCGTLGGGEAGAD